MVLMFRDPKELAERLAQAEERAEMAEAEVTRLRKIVRCENMPDGFDLSDDATTELAVQGAYAAERAKRAEERLKYALRRLDALQAAQEKMREPERTILCDLLANGRLLPDRDGSRYGPPNPTEETDRAERAEAELNEAKGLLRSYVSYLHKCDDAADYVVGRELGVIADKALRWLRRQEGDDGWE